MNKALWIILSVILTPVAVALLSPVLAILLALFLLLAPVFCIPVNLRVEYIESLSVQLRWLFLKVQLVPSPDKAKKKKDKEEEKKEDKPKEEKKQKDGPQKPNILQKFYEYQGIPGFIELLRRTVEVLKQFRHGLWLSFCIRELDLRVSLPGSDPENLAFQYGKLSAAIFPSLGWLCGKLRTRRGKIRANIYPDFTGQSSREIQCTAEVSVIPSMLIGALIMLVVRLGIRVGLKFYQGTKPAKK